MTPEQYEEYYKECCGATYDKDNPDKLYGQVVRTLGICSSTGYGDGEYNVYADVKNGRVVKIVINFEE